METSKYIRWFDRNKDYLSIKNVEKDINCPETSLNHYVAGKRSLPKKWRKPLEEWIKNFRKLQ